MASEFACNVYVKGCGVPKWKEVYLTLSGVRLAAFKDEASAASGASVLALSLGSWAVLGALERRECPKKADHGFALMDLGSPGGARSKGAEDELWLAFASEGECAVWRERLRVATQTENAELIGVPLALVFAKAGGVRAPWPLQRMLAHLRRIDALGTSGLFRVPGAASDVQRLRDAFNTSRSAADDALAQTADPHAVAQLAKAFLRELPEPLLTNERWHAFADAAFDVPLLAQLVAELPQQNRFTLQFLVSFLCDVAERSAENQMDAHNLAIVIGPNLVAPDAAAAAGQLGDSAVQMCQTLIEAYKEIFADVEEEAYNEEQKSLGKRAINQLHLSPAPRRKPHTRRAQSSRRLSMPQSSESSPPPEEDYKKRLSVSKMVLTQHQASPEEQEQQQEEASEPTSPAVEVPQQEEQQRKSKHSSKDKDKKKRHKKSRSEVTAAQLAAARESIDREDDEEEKEVKVKRERAREKERKEKEEEVLEEKVLEQVEEKKEKEEKAKERKRKKKERSKKEKKPREALPALSGTTGDKLAQLLELLDTTDARLRKLEETVTTNGTNLAAIKEKRKRK